MESECDLVEPECDRGIGLAEPECDLVELVCDRSYAEKTCAPFRAKDQNAIVLRLSKRASIHKSCETN